MTYFPPCHPNTNGLSPAEVDKLIGSTLPSKVSRVKDWCADCAIQLECLRLGSMTSMDGTRVVLPGIFGGMTQAERVDLDRAAVR